MSALRRYELDHVGAEPVRAAVRRPAGAVPDPADGDRLADDAAARRADGQPRRRLGRCARGGARPLRGHGRRRHARPLVHAAAWTGSCSSTTTARSRELLESPYERGRSDERRGRRPRRVPVLPPRPFTEGSLRWDPPVAAEERAGPAGTTASTGGTGPTPDPDADPTARTGSPRPDEADPRAGSRGARARPRGARSTRTATRSPEWSMRQGDPSPSGPRPRDVVLLTLYEQRIYRHLARDETDAGGDRPRASGSGRRPGGRVERSGRAAPCTTTSRR